MKKIYKKVKTKDTGFPYYILNAVTRNTQKKVFMKNWEKEFNKRWNYGSFCWNSEVFDGVKFAKQTRRKMKNFIKELLEGKGV